MIQNDAGERISTQKPKKPKLQKAPLEKDPQSLIKLLQQQTLFKGLTLDELRTIDKQIVVRPVPADTHLLTTTEQGTEVYFLLTGRVKIYTQEQHGYCVTLGFREKGELLGEISTIDGLLPSANVITTEPSSVLIFKKRHFLRDLKTMPSLAFHVSTVLVERIRSATTHITTLSTMDTSSRIARQLLALSNAEYSLSRNGKGQKGDAGRSPMKQEIVLPSKMTQQELSEMVGCSREQVNRILKKFAQENVISKSVGKPWIILDCEKLKRHAQ